MKIRALDNQLEIATPAKVNYFLEVCSRQPNGFHELDNVMTSVSIYDLMRFSERDDSNFTLTIDRPFPGNVPAETDRIPTDSSNLIHQALERVRSAAQDELGDGVCSTGIAVQLLKNIPSAAGLGGASSNAAAALIAANRIWQLDWPLCKLSEIASKLGSDIPFFLTGGTAVCQGRGEVVKSLDVPAGLSIVIAKPSDSLSTAKIFGRVEIPDRPINSLEMVQSVRDGEPPKDWQSVGQSVATVCRANNGSDWELTPRVQSALLSGPPNERQWFELLWCFCQRAGCPPRLPTLVIPPAERKDFLCSNPRPHA